MLASFQWAPCLVALYHLLCTYKTSILANHKAIATRYRLERVYMFIGNFILPVIFIRNVWYMYACVVYVIGGKTWVEHTVRCWYSVQSYVVGRCFLQTYSAYHNIDHIWRMVRQSWALNHTISEIAANHCVPFDQNRLLIHMHVWYKICKKCESVKTHQWYSYLLIVHVVESLELVPLLPSSLVLSRPSLLSLWPLVSDWSCSSSCTTAYGSFSVYMVDPSRVSRTFGGCVAGLVPKTHLAYQRILFVSPLACLLVFIGNFLYSWQSF